MIETKSPVLRFKLSRTVPTSHDQNQSIHRPANPQRLALPTYNSPTDTTASSGIDTPRHACQGPSPSTLSTSKLASASKASRIVPASHEQRKPLEGTPTRSDQPIWPTTRPPTPMHRQGMGLSSCMPRDLSPQQLAAASSLRFPRIHALCQHAKNGQIGSLAR